MDERAELKTRFAKEARAVLGTALVATLLASALAVAVNLARPNGLPFFADRPYDILVPCPEPGGAVTPLDASDSVLRENRVFFVDARPEAAFAAWRIENARNLTYDYLDPVPEADIDALSREIAASRSKAVVVYGDGELPDTGEQLGKELSGHGIKNVFFVKGGAPALQERRKETK